MEEGSDVGERLAQWSWLWGAVALLALLILLASLMGQEPDSSWGIPGVRLMPRLPAPVVYALVGLFVLGGVTVFAVLFPRGVRFRRKKGPDEFELYQEPPKLSFGMLVMLLLTLLLPIGLLVYLYWGGWPVVSGEHQAAQKAPTGFVAAPPQKAFEEKPAAEAPQFTWALFVLATLVGLGILGGGVWILFGERLERWWYGITFTDEMRRALLEAVEIGLDDILHEPDPRRAVIACYQRLELVLRQHGLPRAPWQTPF